MNDDRKKELLMKAVDGLATAAEIEELEKYTREDPVLDNEYKAFRRIKEVTDSIKFKEQPDSYWENYWENIYRNLERKTGWVLFSIGAIIILLFAGYQFLEGFYFSEAPLILKIGVSFAGVGVITLLVSIVREVLFARKKERYKEVIR